VKLLRRIAIGIVAVAVVGYAAVLGYIYVNQRALQYDQSGELLALGDTGLASAELVAIPTADGSPLAGWYQKPAPGKPAILYFRGNSGSFSREHARYEAFVADGFGFLAFDYRGFPGSPGELTQQHVLEDGLAAFDWLAQKGDPIVVWGRSLGSGPATYVLSRREADALFYETPFTSAVAVARDRYPYLPVELLMADQYPVVQWLAGVDEPVFVAHGTNDHTIAGYHGDVVYGLAKNPRGIWVVEGADHDDLWTAGEWEKARAFFTEVEAAAHPDASG
jgi:pimeloyl-ACP methyl ester carboxylesterase